MTVKTVKPTRKHARKRCHVETFGILQVKKPLDLRFKLSPSGAREARVSLENALAAGGRFSAAQLRLDACDLDSIYIYLGPAQVKMLVGRLKALELALELGVSQ